MPDCREGESGCFARAALVTRPGPQAGKRSLEAGGYTAVGGEGDQPFPPFG